MPERFIISSEDNETIIHFVHLGRMNMVRFNAIFKLRKILGGEGIVFLAILGNEDAIKLFKKPSVFLCSIKIVSEQVEIREVYVCPLSKCKIQKISLGVNKKNNSALCYYKDFNHKYHLIAESWSMRNLDAKTIHNKLKTIGI